MIQSFHTPIVTSESAIRHLWMRFVADVHSVSCHGINKHVPGIEKRRRIPEPLRLDNPVQKGTLLPLVGEGVHCVPKW
jgi:hypothetical protein